MEEYASQIRRWSSNGKLYWLRLPKTFVMCEEFVLKKLARLRESINNSLDG